MLSSAYTKRRIIPNNIITVIILSSFGRCRTAVQWRHRSIRENPSRPPRGYKKRVGDLLVPLMRLFWRHLYDTYFTYCIRCVHRHRIFTIFPVDSAQPKNRYKKHRTKSYGYSYACSSTYR